jgi:hypothetical protein
MTTSKSTPRCLQTAERGGRALICYRAKGHDLMFGESDPDKAAHYDPDANQYFGYPGQIVISIEIPGKADVLIEEDVPDTYGAMSDDERRNHMGYREESYRELMNVSARYVAPGEEI